MIFGSQFQFGSNKLFLGQIVVVSTNPEVVGTVSANPEVVVGTVITMSSLSSEEEIISSGSVVVVGAGGV